MLVQQKGGPQWNVIVTALTPISPTLNNNPDFLQVTMLELIAYTWLRESQSHSQVEDWAIELSLSLHSDSMQTFETK